MMEVTICDQITAIKRRLYVVSLLVNVLNIMHCYALNLTVIISCCMTRSEKSPYPTQNPIRERELVCKLQTHPIFRFAQSTYSLLACVAVMIFPGWNNNDNNRTFIHTYFGSQYSVTLQISKETLFEAGKVILLKIRENQSS